MLLHPHHHRPAHTPRWSALAVAITFTAFLATWSVLPSPAEAATTYWVEKGGTGADGTAADPCGTIAEALAKAGDGDTIMIADGVYTEPGLEIADAVTLQGQSATGTIIQAHENPDEAPNRVLYVPEATGTVAINDLTIRHGNIRGIGNGGGLAVDPGNEVSVTRCAIVDNISTGGGGGVYNGVSTLHVNDSEVSRNAANGGSGGGIYNDDGVVTVSGSVISGNSTPSWNGGGIAVEGGRVTVRDRSTVGGTAPADANTAVGGGGLAVEGGELVIDGARIVGNGASDEGGGILATIGSLSVRRSVLEGNVANNGGALVARLAVTVSLSHSAFNSNAASGQGDAVYNRTDAVFGGSLGASDNWWGDASGPAPGAIVDGPEASPTIFAPWLASLEVTANPTDATEGDPVEVTATLRDSDGGDASEHLAVRFSHSSGLPDADVPFASPAKHTFDAAEGDDTITGTVLFAGQESTLTGSTLVTAAPLPAPRTGPRDLPSDDAPSTLTEGGLRVALAHGCFEEAAVPASGDLVLSTDDDCGDVEVTAPEGSLPAGHTLVLGVPADLDDLPPAEGDASHRLAFVLQLQDEDGEVVTGDVDGRVMVDVTVPADPVHPPEPVHPNELLVAYWDGEAWVDVLAEVVEEPDGSLSLTFEVDHFTLFAAQEDPGRGQLTPEPASSGTSLARWGGGPASLLPQAKSYWMTSDGRFLAYTPDGPVFVNEAFLSLWPDGVIPEGALLIVVR